MLEYVQSINIEALLASYGYIIIVLLTFVEGETIVILAGIAAAHGMLDPYLVALCAFTGTLGSDQLMFSLGKYKGDAVLRFVPKLEPKIARASRLMQRYDTWLILGFRFVYGIRNVTPIMLGISGVSHLKFLLLNIVGAGAWACLFTAGGYFLGNAFIHFMGHVGKSVIYFLLLVVACLILLRLFRARRLKKDAKKTG